jgi:4-carboxymuconolactone decarboxylase
VALIPYADPGSAPATMRKALTVVPPLNVFRMLANTEAGFWPYVDYNAALLAKLDLDPVLRELAILRVAALDRCDYERVHHEGIARQVGASGAQIARAVEPAAGAADLEGLVYEVVAGVVADNRAPREAVVALNDRVGPGQVVELMMAITHYHGLAALAASVEMELEEADGLSVLAGAEEGWVRD